MAWNQPGNNGQDNDPWGNNNSNKTNNSAESILYKINRLLKKSPSNGSSSSPNKDQFNFSIFFAGILLIIVVIWLISGFYTINPNQRGVITRLGLVQPEIIQPGINWKLSLVDDVHLVDTQSIQGFDLQSLMITAGDKLDLVSIDMNVQYQINNPSKYLFNVTNVEDSLQQAAYSALRTIINHSSMEAVLTGNRAHLETQTKQQLIDIVSSYDMGITIVDLQFKSIRPPKEIQESYNDIDRANEEYNSKINEAEVKKVEIVQEAQSKATKIIAEANLYQISALNEAQSNIAYFEKILPAYKESPELTKINLYIQAMENILSKTNKNLVNDKNGNLLILPLEQKHKINNSSNDMDNKQNNLNHTNDVQSNANNAIASSITSTTDKTSVSNDNNTIRSRNAERTIRTGRVGE